MLFSFTYYYTMAMENLLEIANFLKLNFQIISAYQTVCATKLWGILI